MRFLQPENEEISDFFLYFSRIGAILRLFLMILQIRVENRHQHEKAGDRLDSDAGRVIAVVMGVRMMLPRWDYSGFFGR